ncbi:hypothetical protein B0J13DRAFT_312580 [Dactylonectria estremocensis]|uniref:DUF6536 domain-containing protein n=1 Tax=Dactylonectria estremocensis TaxID=1079267 RepID=A0A9P9F0N3_9HYPO|nr:hypothetical protein B0J13DRAFT_312580 [Dactylonectria estremocensis]
MEGTFPPSRPPPPSQSSSYRNVWEKQGMGRDRTIGSISEEPGQSGPGTGSVSGSGPGSGSRPRTRGFTNSSGRPTVRWPFHSFNNSRSSVRYTSSLRHTRSGSLPHRAASSISRSVSSVLGSDIIPDYVVNFLRGETPESLARKHRIPESPDTSNFPNHNYCETPGHGNFLMSESRAGTPRAEMEKMLRNQTPPSTVRKLTTGWRGGVTLNALLALLVFVAAIVCLALAAANGKISGGGSSVVDGDVGKVRSANWGIHAVVNVFAIVLIAGANYVVQILTSPTRCEVDIAHEKFNWVDIGIPSLRNLGLISSTRAALSATLLVLAVGSQIIYNALIFSSHSAAATNMALVSTSFIESGSISSKVDFNGMSRSELVKLQTQAKDDNLIRLTPKECISTFNDLFQTEYDAVLIISKSGTNLDVETAEAGTMLTKFFKGLDKKTDSINYCLAESADDSTSSLNLSGPLLALIAFFNMFFLLALAVALLLALTRSDFKPLVTLGDALSSFLEDPDPTTQEACMMTKSDIKKGSWGQREAKFWTPNSYHWMSTPSVQRWAVWLLTYLVPLGLTAAALAVSIKAAPKNPFSSFGEATAVYQLRSGSRVGLAIVTALPQVLIGVLYLSSNALLTLFFLSHEMSMFVAPGRLIPLRVSSGQPIGAQTTSLYLTLPRPLSWILFFTSAAMAFLLSQGVVLVAVDRDDGTSHSGIGFSPLPLLILLALLATLGFIVLGFSLRKADPRGAIDSGDPAGNPMTLPGGSCSAVLSSRCHRVPQEDGVEALAVRWGVVREGIGMYAGHATFSARPVGDILVGRSYA